jgi:hypothetical protein
MLPRAQAKPQDTQCGHVIRSTQDRTVFRFARMNREGAKRVGWVGGIYPPLGAYRGGSKNRKALFEKWDLSLSFGQHLHCVVKNICSVERDVLEALYLHDLVTNLP